MDSSMTADEFRHHIDALGWTKQRTADELGRNIATIFRYLNGDLPVPETVAKLLVRMAAE